ncbi:MAG: RNA methyltransferase [Victivallales bacterium]|nr:RNA methyltransferase [Victivallales bacterium]
MPQSTEIIYGINPVFEAVRAERREIVRAWINKDSNNNPRLKKLIQYLGSKNIHVEFADKARLFDLTGTREHQGAVLEASPFPHTPFAEMIGSERMVLLDSIEDPHNIGAIMRTAEAMGWKNVLLPRHGSPLILPSVCKSSAGAVEHLNVAVNCSANQYVKIAMENGYDVIALDGGGKTSLESFRGNMPEKVLLVVGGENAGVSQFILNTCTHVASIHQQGRINSLNASVAAAIAIYLLTPQQEKTDLT